MITREAFLNFGASRRFKLLSIPGLGELKIRSLKESERSAYEADRFGDGGEIIESRVRDSKARLIALCVCDEHGEPLLRPEDVDRLSDKDGALTGLLFDECWQHCGFNRRDIETILGNWNPTNTADSP